MRDNIEKEMIKKRVHKAAKNFNESFNDPLKFNKIYKELGFSYGDDSCNGYCPECEKMYRCDIYKEIRDEREWIYT